jgi:hypothetical protein
MAVIYVAFVVCLIGVISSVVAAVLWFKALCIKVPDKQDTLIGELQRISGCKSACCSGLRDRCPLRGVLICPVSVARTISFGDLRWAKCGAHGRQIDVRSELEGTAAAADRAVQRLRRPKRPPSRSRYKGRWLKCSNFGGECVPLLSQFEKFGLGCLLEGYVSPCAALMCVSAVLLNPIGGHVHRLRLLDRRHFQH